MKYILLLFGFTVLFSSSCSKNGKDCWMAFSPQGQDAMINPICNATKKEVEAQFPGHWVYRYGETKYCYRATKANDPSFIHYIWGIPGSLKGNVEKEYGVLLTRVDCSSFCRLQWNEKHKSKITGFFVGGQYL